MGRKAHGSHEDSRVAEISTDIRDPAFFVDKVGQLRWVWINRQKTKGGNNDHHAIPLHEFPGEATKAAGSALTDPSYQQ